MYMWIVVILVINVISQQQYFWKFVFWFLSSLNGCKLITFLVNMAAHLLLLPAWYKTNNYNYQIWILDLSSSFLTENQRWTLKYKTIPFQWRKQNYFEIWIYICPQDTGKHSTPLYNVSNNTSHAFEDNCYVWYR